MRVRSGSGTGSATSIGFGQRSRSKIWIGFAITLVVVLLLSATAARADPGSTCKCANCAPTCSGGCPKGTVGITVSMTVTNPTNVTVKVTVSVNSTVYFYWGNTTNYGFTLLDGTWFSSSSLTHSYFIDFLEPSTTYYYEAKASTSCYYGGTDQGSWKTGSDSMTTFSGVIRDVNGQKAPQYTSVIAWCYNSVDNYHWSAQAFVQSTTTGQYSLTAWNGCSPPNGNGYHVAVLLDGTYLGYIADTWNGHWNSTIVTWAPQVINFVLDVSPLSTQPVTTAMEFSHSGFALVSYCKDTSSSAESEADYSVSGTLFGLSYSLTSSTQYADNLGSSSCSVGQGEPGFEAWGYPHVAGNLVFNAIASREWSIPWEEYYGPLSNSGSGNATGGPLQDWLSEPSSESASCVDNQGAYMYHYTIPAGSSTQFFNFSAGGSITGVNGEAFGVSVPLELDGQQVGSIGGTWGYTFTTSISYEYYVSAVFPGPYSQAHYFTVACSGSSSSNTGIVIHIWQDSGPA